MATVEQPEFSARQITALTAVGNGALTAREVAEAIEPGSDARGAAQTLRRLSPDFVEKGEDGYKLTRKGKNVVRKHSGSDA